MARLGGGLTGAGLGLITGVVTARELGAEGRGALALLTCLAVLAAPLCGLGAGDACQVLVGRGAASMQRALSGSLPPVLLSSGVGAALLWLAVATFSEVDVAAGAVTAITLPILVLVMLLGRLVDAGEDVAFAAVTRIWSATVTTFATVLALVVLDTAVTGAVLAVLLGSAAGLGLLIHRTASWGLQPLPRADRGYLVAALPIAAPSTIAAVLVVATARLDLVVVGALAGWATAGNYSVALTVGSLVPYAAVALTSAATPSMVRLPAVEARALIARVCRIGVGAGLLTAAALGVTAPFLVPLAFGQEYRAAVAPTVLLVAAGVLSGAQWATSRCCAVRGRPHVLVLSYGVSSAALVGGDLLLVPQLGLTGAGVAAGLSATAGLLVACAFGRGIVPSPRGLLPTHGDTTLALATARSLLRHRGRPAQEQH